jgi:hypothetical protein
MGWNDTVDMWVSSQFFVESMFPELIWDIPGIRELIGQGG